MLVLNGMNYDPFMEYSISVIAVHDPESKQHYNPNGPDFMARVYTGMYQKPNKKTEEFVKPDACCGIYSGGSK